MILVTRLNGPVFGLNPDLIERAEATPDTVVTLVDGTKYVIAEPLLELLARIRDFRASVITAAHEAETAAELERAAAGSAGTGRAPRPAAPTLVALPGGEA